MNCARRSARSRSNFTRTGYLNYSHKCRMQALSAADTSTWHSRSSPLLFSLISWSYRSSLNRLHRSSNRSFGQRASSAWWESFSFSSTSTRYSVCNRLSEENILLKHRLQPPVVNALMFRLTPSSRCYRDIGSSSICSTNLALFFSPIQLIMPALIGMLYMSCVSTIPVLAKDFGCKSRPPCP
jgi:hypothetical protein